MTADATILFAGTPEFARVSLQALVEAGIAPAVVMTQPDRPAGRGKKMTASPVKRYAVDVGIDVWQPPTLRGPDAVAEIQKIAPSLMIVAAYGLILPQPILDIPKQGCVNVHASLLPRWRGAAPIQHAILSGDSETGICLMKMEAGLDTGPVYASSAVEIGPTETAGELHDRLSTLGAQVLVNNVDDLLQGNKKPIPQNDKFATYAKKIQKRDAKIDWSQPAGEILARIRAFNPTPGAYFSLGDQIIKCWRAEHLCSVDKAMKSRLNGQVLDASKVGVDIACQDGAIRLLEVQRPSRGRITAAEFAAQLNLTDKRLS